MPIKSTKPSKKAPYKGKEAKPWLGHFKTEAQLAARVPQARRDVQRINRIILRTTQPYSRAAALRAGMEFPKQQMRAMRKEKVGAPPPRGSRGNRFSG